MSETSSPTRIYGPLAIAIVAAGVVLLALVVAAALWFSDQVRDQNKDVTQRQEAVSTANALIALIERAESGRRGFLLTGDEQFAAVATEAVSQIRSPLDGLAQVFTSADSSARLQHIRTMIESRLDAILRSIEVARQGGPEAARASFNRNGGQQQLINLRDEIGALVASQQRVLTDEMSTAETSADRLFFTTAICIVLVLAMGLAFVFLVRRYVRLVAASRAELADLNAGLEQAVEERTADLLHANAEIQRFAYIVSHDLRSPLVNIMGFTSELEAGLADVQSWVTGIAQKQPDLVTTEARQVIETDWPESIGFIRKATEKMDRLINAILKLSREGRRVFTPQRLNLTEIFTGIADAVRHQADEANAEIVVQQPLPDIIGDRVAIEQIFGNLVDNAVKYLASDRAGRVEIRSKDLGRAVEIAVADNGRGIDPSDRERIFELFRRSGVQDRPGEGIGLAHVQTLVRRLGGSIACNSALGTGSTFRVILPKVQRHERQDREEQKEAA